MDPKMTELLANLADLTDDQLAEMRASLMDAARDALGDPSDDNLKLAQELVDAKVAVEGEQNARAEDAAARDQKAQELLSLLGDDGDPDAADEVVTEDDTDAEAKDDTADDADTADKREPVAASGTPAGAGVEVGNGQVRRVAARRPAPYRMPEATPAPLASLSLVASANVPDKRAGTELRGEQAITAAFQSVFDSHVKGARMDGAFIKVGTLRMAYGEDRTLSDGDVVGNEKKIRAARQAAQREGAITASGGLCLPLNTDYALPVMGVSTRPIRDGWFAQFGADRGGVKTLAPPSLASVSGGVAAWTEANDQSPASPTTKPYVTVDCPTERETKVEAITKRLKFGEFRRRFFPEQIAAWWELLGVQHARYAEGRLIANGPGKTVAGGGYAKAVTVGEGLGAASDFVRGLKRIRAVLVSSRRIDPNTTLNLAAPWYLPALLAADLAAEGPGTGTTDERFAKAEATIAGWITQNGFRFIPLMDGESGQVFSLQGNAAALQGWPSTVVTYVSLPGEWLFTNGGTLDLGLVRDNALVDTNDVMMFAETFEGAHFTGLETWRVTFDLCPSGKRQAGTTSFDPCAIGS